MVQLAMPCADGAEPKPDWIGKSIQANMNWLPPDVLAFIGSVSPLSTTQNIVGTIVVSMLCANQAQDPGPLSIGDLVWDLVGAAVPNPLGSPGTLGWWIGQKLQYYAFWNVCQCKTTGAPPPTPVTPTPPAGSQPFPTDPQQQPPIVQVINNQAAATESLFQLYQGLQLTAQHSADLRAWTTPSRPYSAWVFPITMENENYFDIPPTYPSGDAFNSDIAGLELHIDQLPTKYKVRGSLNPRYYGVGSVYWKTAPGAGGQQLISSRESLHYRHQAMALPRTWVPQQIAWYLQPGASVTGYLLMRDPLVVNYPPSPGTESSWNTFGTVTPPPGFEDPPMVPNIGEIRSLPPGGGLPPAPFDCCS